jgi:hypothetical protein
MLSAVGKTGRQVMDKTESFSSASEPAPKPLSTPGMA